jgi:tetratricopeptide (TPR) repeat protein
MSPLPSWITEWSQGWLCMATGFVAGGAYLFFTRRDRTPSADLQAEIADAERRKELLVEELRELAEERHKLGEDRYVAERDRLEKAAAGALRARDEALNRVRSGDGRKAARQTQTKPAAGLVGWFDAHPQLKGAAWGSGLVLFFVLIWRLLGAAETPRGEGGTMTGINPGAQPTSSQGSQPDPHDSQLQPLIQAVQRDPEDVAALDRLSHELLNRGDFAETSDLVERALRIDPIDIEARAHRAALKSAQGDDQAALDELERLAARYPNAPEVVLFDGLTARHANQNERAIASLERFIHLAPPSEDTSEVRNLIDSIRAESPKQ